jgi:hypothetical protein
MCDVTADADSKNVWTFRRNGDRGDCRLLSAIPLVEARWVAVAAPSRDGKPGIVYVAIDVTSDCRRSHICGIRRCLRRRRYYLALARRRPSAYCVGSHRRCDQCYGYGHYHDWSKSARRWTLMNSNNATCCNGQICQHAGITIALLRQSQRLRLAHRITERLARDVDRHTTVGRNG